MIWDALYYTVKNTISSGGGGLYIFLSNQSPWGPWAVFAEWGGEMHVRGKY